MFATFVTFVVLLAFFGLFSDLVFGLFEFVVFEVECFFEAVWFFGVTVACKGVEDLWKF